MNIQAFCFTTMMGFVAANPALADDSSAASAASEAPKATATPSGDVSQQPTPVVMTAAAPATAAPATAVPATAVPATAVPVGPGVSQAPAQTAPPPEDDAVPKGTMLIVVPEVVPPVPRTAHVHDGFYARIDMGIGSLAGDFDDGHISGQDLSARGPNLALDLLLGYSPAPGVALGLGLFTDNVVSAETEADGQAADDRNLQLTIAGLFVDGFPKSRRGWHLGGSLGGARLRLEADAATGGRIDAYGLGGVIWGGYDAWVADEWSVGGLVRLAGSVTSGDADGVDVTAMTRSITFMFTALMH